MATLMAIFIIVIIKYNEKNLIKSDRIIVYLGILKHFYIIVSKLRIPKVFDTLILLFYHFRWLVNL